MQNGVTLRHWRLEDKGLAALEDGEADAVEEGDAFEEEDFPDALGVFERERFEEQRREPTTAPNNSNISNPPLALSIQTSALTTDARG